MDDQAQMKIYGNPDLPEGTEERPLVTFALFAYNQEKYIREAVEGAFSQTYEPLEIILSDDCSSDKTFEIMQEMAAAYEGPHKVQVRQSEVNRGTLAHLFEVNAQSRGIYLIVGAGDDISFPDRTSKSVSLMISENLQAMSGRALRFGEYQAEHREAYELADGYRHESALNNLKLKRIRGATACYRRSSLPRVTGRLPYVLLEDIF